MAAAATTTTISSSIQDVLSGNIHKKIPLTTYESTLLPTYNQIQQIETPQFDPDIHLTYYQNDLAKHKFQMTRRVTMEELGLTHPDQISKIGVSDPFQLFTPEAVAIMRKEILNKETFMRFARYNFNSTSGMDCCIRGYVKNDDEITCPFIYQAWTHPKTMDLINKMAGVELEIVMDYEIGHVNISMKDTDEQEEQAPQAMKAVVDWHHDAYPFVCVLMLSDTSSMIGGETCLRMSNNEVVKISGPKQGSASMLQGRMIEHIAPVPQGMSERITMVTSFRAKSPLKRDTSILDTVKPEINFGTRYNDFYSQWVNYRIDLMNQQLSLIKECKDEDGNFQKMRTISSLKQVEAYLKQTYTEMGFSKEELDLIYK